MESALQGSQGTVSKQLKQLHGRCMMQLEDLVELIRGPLSDLERKVGKEAGKRGALVVHIVVCSSCMGASISYCFCCTLLEGDNTSY